MSQPITPDAIFDLTQVSSPSLSPDGRLLAFVEAEEDRESGGSRSRIMVKALPGGESRALTQGPSDGAPRFSPDGGVIAFIRPDAEGRTQVWVVPIAGEEPRQLTTLLGGASEHAWSPDSRRIAFVSDVDPDAQSGPDSDDRPRVTEVHRIRYRADGAGWRGDAFRHVFVVDAVSGETRQLTDGEGDDRSPVWSPDGSRIALVADRRADRDMTHFMDAWVISKDGGEPEMRSEGLCVVGAAAWSPDGASLVAIGDDDPEMVHPRQRKLYVLESIRPPRPLTDGMTAPTLPAPELRWTDDGRILFLGDRKGESFVCSAAAGGPVGIVAGGGVRMKELTLDAQARTAVVNVIPTSSAGNLSGVDLVDGAMTQVTCYNEGYFADHPPAEMKKFTISRAGFEIESRLLLPPDFDPSLRYPLVLDIHGGPQGRFSDSFDLDQQVLATAGYLVLGVNPRGSSSYGHDFSRAVHRDWGGEDYRDIMAAVDEVCSRSYVDETRMGVGGYSYGGYMSAWIVGHETWFKAAVVGAPCVNLVSLYGTSE